LANALRHTNTNGKVLIKIKCQPGNKYFPEGFVNISIKDTGCGITKERLPYIFDLYYQANEDKIGTGIGLALTKGLIQLHHGDISVKSELNWGTQFSFNLPLGKKHINKKEIIRSQNSVKNNGSGILKEVDYNEEIEPSLHPSKTDPKSEIILLIDDQPDWRNYVKENLSDQYQIIEAKDGGEGYGLAISNDPDMIICDINLPVLDGLKLCEKLKNDLRTSHIPLLLLTGRADEDDEIEGFDAGADDYITKPVKLKVLKARIRNHLSQSQNVIKTIKRTGSIDSVIKLDSPETKEFLIKFRSIIDENLSSGKYFDMTILAKKMGMSRKSLYRKFSKTIDMSPGDYAYEIRLQKAASLLLHSNETIEKIALNVGFSSGSHLAKRFRDRFGLSPNDYRDKN
jgi:DNA-binding response OmpR family regulator